MGDFHVVFTSAAEREFARLPRDVMLRFGKALDLMVRDPTRRRSGVDVRRLQGQREAWRLRVGEYRGIFALSEDAIVFTRLAHRAKVYDF